MSNFKQQLLNNLEKIASTGTFVSTGVENFCFPEMKIKYVDEIVFPLNKIQLQEIIKVANKAPFGKGSETILDENVRNCWEIDASEIMFEGNNWSKTLEKIIHQIQPDLGIEGKKIEAHLYKLLIYEEGNFFLPHKDSEKEKGMFGTLIIGLPSKHTGGEIIIKHEKSEKVISFVEATANNNFPYIAFYADCDHEIKPITSGYRVCLVYNLIDLQENSSIKLYSLQQEIETINSILTNQKEKQEKPYIYLLGHQYTPANFSLEQLKLHDRPKAEVLLQAAENTNYYAKLALVTSYQSGSLEMDYDDYSYGRRRGRYYDNYENEIDVDNAEMGEVYDEYITIDHWENSAVPFLGNIDVNEEDLIHNLQLNEGEPTEKEAEGYTGNAGMEMMYWYHYGAVVFWKKENHLNILANSSFQSQILWLRYYVRDWNSINFFEQKMAKYIFEHFLSRPIASRYNDEIDFNTLIDFLLILNDDNFLLNEAKITLFPNFTNISVEKWTELFSHFSKLNLNWIIDADSILNNKKNLNYLLKIANELDDHSYQEFIDECLENIPKTLAILDLSKDKNINLKELIINIIKISSYKKTDLNWINKMTQNITKNLDRDFVNIYLIENILSHKLQHSPLGIEILKVAKKYLENRVNNKPQPPKNWSREVPESRDYSKIWGMLADFLRSPEQQIFEFKSLQTNRTEMENAIRNTTIDLDTETIRKGSPHTLKLTKNTNAYHHQLKKWEEDCKLMEKMG